MSDYLKVLNSHLARGNAVEFHELLNLLKNQSKINDEIYFKYLGFFHLKKNNFDIAEKNLLKSLKFNDQSFDTHLNLGVCYLKQNKTELSLAHFEKSLNLKNDFVDTYILLSRSLRVLNLDTKSIEILNQGIKKTKEGNSKIYLELAEIFREKRDYILAIPNYHQVIKKNLKNHILYNSLAVCYEAIGEIYLAEKNYLKAIKIKPDYFEAIANLGNLKRSVGENTHALELFEKCLNLDGPKSKIFRYISIFHKFRSDEDKFLIMMKNYLKDNNLKNSDPDIPELYFALVKAYEDLKDIENFGHFLNLANQEKRNSLSDLIVDKELKFFELIKKTFSLDLINQMKPEIDGSKIILVLGMPRSGTTLVEQILASHSKVTAGGEQVFFQNILKDKFDFFNFDNFKKQVESNLKNDSEKIASQYTQQLKTIHENNIVTDKLPFNFFYIGFYFSVFNNIKIINVYRDAMDNCFSIYKNFFPEQISFVYDQKELAEYYLKYFDLIKYWSNVYKDRIFNIKYEDLVHRPEELTKSLLNYCNLDWEDNCLKFYENKNAVKTLSSTQVRSPIYSSSVKSWSKYKNYLKILEHKLAQENFRL